jgi:hypothetical protein
MVFKLVEGAQKMRDKSRETWRSVEHPLRVGSGRSAQSSSRSQLRSKEGVVCQLILRQMVVFLTVCVFRDIRRISPLFSFHSVP